VEILVEVPTVEMAAEEDTLSSKSKAVHFL
jgi:hypothetical protein